MTSAEPPAATFLARLLTLSERSPDRTRPASLAPDYDELKTAQDLQRFHADIEKAMKCGAVSIRNGKRERRHIVERVTVHNAAALARHLGRSPAHVMAREAREKLELLVADPDSWLIGIIDEVESRWARGESAFRMHPLDVDTALELLMLLLAISKGQAQGVDSRTFSLRATGDTKSFDRQASRVASILAIRFADPQMLAHDVWRRIGLDRFSHPTHLRGPVVVEDTAGILVHGRAKPFASIHLEMLPFLKVVHQPTMILTIENYASFNRYVREIDDGGLIVYLGGFASVSVVETVRTLLHQTGLSLPFFHWGDVDPGGLRIFAFLEQNLPVKPLPHLMDRSIAEKHGKLAAREPSLSSIASSGSRVASVAEWLAYGDDVRHLEQEALDPISPQF